MSLIIKRREFLVGLTAALFAGPAIVRAASIMPVRAPLISAPPFIAIEPTRAWIVAGIEQVWDIYPTAMRTRLRLIEAHFVGSVPTDVPRVRLTKADVLGIDVKRFHGQIPSWTGDPPTIYESRPAEATIDLNRFSAFSYEQHLNKIVELE